MRNQIVFFISVLFLLLNGTANAQIDSLKFMEADADDISLSDLLNVKVTVASKQALTQRESPGIISVVSEREIRNSGARDMIDVLRLVPGISFNSDVQGVVGITMRGNWANEGKVLLLLDGQEMNEILYASLQFGNHYDVNQIKRVEIIRGPGSSIYGGYAEMGVINIITKSGSDLNGIQGNATYGQLSDSYGRLNYSLMAGKKIKDFEFSVSGFTGSAQRSNAVYTDFYGAQANMKNNSTLTPANINVGMSYKDLKVRVIYDNYKNKTVSLFDGVDPNVPTFSYKTLLGDIRYDWKISKKLTITPRFTYLFQDPWSTTKDSNEAFQILAQKYTGSVTVNYAINEKINWLNGVEYFDESGRNKIAAYTPYFASNNSDNIAYKTLSAYSQILVKSKIVNITAGGRFLNHSQFGTAFSPRVGLTKIINDFHFKLLYSKAFRAPSILNVALADNIKPEKTDVLELELGYKLSDKMLLTLNLYDINLKKPIIYYYDAVLDEEKYINAGKTGSRGIEAEYKYSDKWGYLTLNYSYYSTAGKNNVQLYQVAGVKNSLAGFANHLANLNASVNIYKGFSINPSMSFVGERYAYTSIASDSTPVAEKLNPMVLFNLYLNVNDFFTKGLTIGAGVYDLLDQRYSYVQAYNGGLPPLPGTGREIVVRLSYKLGL